MPILCKYNITFAEKKDKSENYKYLKGTLKRASHYSEEQQAIYY